MTRRDFITLLGVPLRGRLRRARSSRAKCIVSAFLPM
jgi:hypothetical protein